MKTTYPDILERLGPPDFYDEHGAPRYGEFHPDKRGQFYAQAVALVTVACQNCAQHYRVVVSFANGKAPPANGDAIAYGDPPPHDIRGGRCVGETMNSVPLAVLEFWRWSDDGWNRVSEMEGTLPQPDWTSDEDWAYYLDEGKTYWRMVQEKFGSTTGNEDTPIAGRSQE